MRTNLEKKGAAQAATLGAMIGILTLAVVNWGTELSDSFKNQVHAVGKLFIPGAQGIGPYSGKEAISLAAWLAGWFILHLVLRRRELSSTTVSALFLAGIAAATTLLWPPATHWAVSALK